MCIYIYMYMYMYIYIYTQMYMSMLPQVEIDPGFPFDVVWPGA